MNFNTPYFLFLFLPVCLMVYFLAQPRWRKWIGLIASLVFYAWGQAFNLPVLVVLILVNYFIGLKMVSNRGQRKNFPWAAVGIVFDLLVLVFFKYVTTFGLIIPGNFSFSAALTQFLGKLQYPAGLSYITFQTISYLVDIQRDMSDGEKDFFTFAWYILLFPKILSGPITRYAELREELNNPQVNLENILYGIRRFIQGLAKKVLIADTLANLVNPVFNMPSPNISPALSWLVLISFAVQLYFDFSGIIDMAIGLGRMLGFHFVENFNYPYISRSISEFWRRWHISLSSWFRDYVFYPLEFNRTIHLGQPLDILIVFLLTGLWHGITPPFIIWGLINGLAMSFESTHLGKRMNKMWAPLQHLYTLAIILAGWVFFRSPSIPFAFSFFKRLAGDASGITPISFAVSHPLPIIEPSMWIALVSGLIFCLPLAPFIQKKLGKTMNQHQGISFSLTVVTDGVQLLLLIFCMAMIASGTYAPGLYGRF